MDIKLSRRATFIAVSALAVAAIVACAYIWNHAPISRVEAAFDECDTIKLRFIEGGGKDIQMSPPKEIAHRGKIDAIRRLLALRTAITLDLIVDYLPKPGGADPRIDFVLERDGRELAHFVVAGNHMHILDATGAEKNFVELSTLDAHWLLAEMHQK